MYSTLSQYNDTTSMDTTSKKYFCSNYVPPKTQNFYNYYNLPSSQNTNVQQLPFYRVNQQGKIIGQPDTLPVVSSDSKESFLPEFRREEQPVEVVPPVNEMINNQKSISLDESTNVDTTIDTKIVPQTNVSKLMNDSSNKPLLPVLDCNFNLREICKQSILLEEHLTQPEKRCTDCCIKHFLALEGLSEEAISLDKEQKGPSLMKDLPTLIRTIQKQWYMNPEKNAHSCSQQLRSIRKSLMESCFPVIFDETQNKLKSCSASSCQLR